MALPVNPACTTEDFSSAGVCYKNLTLHERRALAVYLKAQKLHGSGGTNYTSDFGPSGALNTAAAAYNTMNLVEREVARLVILASRTDAAGGNVPSSAEIADAIVCLKNFSADALDRMDLVLTCALE